MSMLLSCSSFAVYVSLVRQSYFSYLCMRPIHTHVFENVISKPRLKSYRDYFGTKDIDEAIGLYMWNCELSVCFSMLLSFFEISLRNNIHSSMSRFYSRGKNNSYHWYDKFTLKPETKNKIDDIRYEGYKAKRKLRNPQPTPDEIVSRVTFGFWAGVLSSIDLRYANQILPNVFPFHPLNVNSNNWNNRNTKTSALNFIYELNDFRNRIAHHEPLWKFSAIKNTSVKPAIIKIPESTNLEESLYRFQRLLNLLDDAMKAMNPDFHVDMLQSSWRRKLDYLLSEQGISRYKNLKHCPDINQHPLTPLQFRKNFKLIMKKNKPIQVGYSNMKGLFIPE